MTTKTNPTGTTLIRLADIPEDQRIAAAHQLIDEANNIDEILRLIELMVDPQDASGRIAA